MRHTLLHSGPGLLGNHYFYLDRLKLSILVVDWICPLFSQQCHGTLRFQRCQWTGRYSRKMMCFGLPIAQPLVRFQSNPLTLDSCQLGNPTNFLYINLFLFQGVFILLIGLQSGETKKMLSRFFTRVKFDLVQSSRQKREILKAL